MTNDSENSAAVKTIQTRTQNQNQRTVIIDVPWGLTAKTLLRSEAVPMLAATARVVLISPLARHGEFVEEFEHGGVRAVESRAPWGPRRYLQWKLASRIVNVADRWHFADRLEVETMKILLGHLRLTDPKRYERERRIAKFFSPQSLLGRVSKVLAGSGILDGRPYRGLLQELRPSLIVFTHTFEPLSEYLLNEARRTRTPTVGIIHSWDNLTSKGSLKHRYDRLIVWNAIMKQEILRLYPGWYREEEIFVSGMPHVDFYHDRSEYRSREAFLIALGADPRRRTVTFLMGHPTMYQGMNEIAEYLSKLADANRFAKPAQVIIRPHGQDRHSAELRGLMERFRNVVVNLPGPAFDTHSSRWSKKDGMRFLGELLTHSDVVVNYASTTTIEAAYLDRPIVSVVFDGWASLPYYLSGRRFQDETHYRTVREVGGTYMATNFAELRLGVDRYLEHPELDRQERRKIAEHICHFLDGSAGHRIGAFLVDFQESL